MALPFPTLWIDPKALEQRLRPIVQNEYRPSVVDRLLPHKRTRVLLDPQPAHRPEERVFNMLSEIAPLVDHELSPKALREAIPTILAAYDAHPKGADEVGLTLDWPDGVTVEDAVVALTVAPDPACAATLAALVPTLQAHRWEDFESWLSQTWLHTVGTHRGLAAAHGRELFEWLHAWVELSLLARVWRALRAIEGDLGRSIIAIDAGHANHTFLSQVRDLPKRGEFKVKPREGFAEIIAPKQRVGVRLDIHDIPTRIIDVIRQWRSWHGLRHWAAMLRLLTQAGRTGRVVWHLEKHLEALAYEDRSRRDPEVRKRVADEVEALTRMEVAVFNANGSLRLRAPLLGVTQRAEQRRGDEWTLEGLELIIHPLLYNGVRKGNGDVGSLWAPAPVELSQIDHVRYPYSIALGLILPIRWRWDVSADVGHITLTGEKLLEMAGIKLHTHNASRAWESLKDNLEELMRINALEHYEWHPGEEWSLTGRCDLLQPHWVRDRMVHSITPREEQIRPTILTGYELNVWRKRRELTQQQLADELQVSRRTVIRAENSPDEPLSAQLRRAIEQRIEMLFRPEPPRLLSPRAPSA